MRTIRTHLERRPVLKRARSAEQKSQRREEIISTTCRLLTECSPEKLSLNAIAREAALSKPSIYLYFSTREEIFLAVFMEAFSKWMDTTTAVLDAMESFTIAEIARAMVHTAWKNSELRLLAPLLVTSIEKNISDECMATVIRLKREKCNALCKEIQRCLPEMTEAKTFHLMLCTMSLFGQFVSYEQNACLNRVLGQREFAPLRDDWKVVVGGTVNMLLTEILKA